MREINGFQYITEEEAQNAVNLCNLHYGITNWCPIHHAELNVPTFWYIVYEYSLLVVLGEPTTFDVVTPPTPTPSPTGSTENYSGITL
jgi:hypothetical protein